MSLSDAEQIKDVFQECVRVFGDEAIASRVFDTAQKALEKHTPRDLCQTAAGRRAVGSWLIAIDEGMFL